MQILIRILATALALAFLHGCVPGLKGAKNQPETRDLRAQAAPNMNNPAMPATPGPVTEAKGSGDLDTPGGRSTNLSLKDLVNRSALEFAKHIPNVKHVKTCYSQMGGEWYMIVYIERGKKISFEHYTWNKRDQQWELVYRHKDLPLVQLEGHLKEELGDEKCFVLK